MAVEAGRVLIAYMYSRSPESAGGSAQHDDLIMSHMRRELLGGGAEQSVNSRNIDLLHGTSFLQTGFCVVRRTACDVRHARSRDHAPAGARTLCSFARGRLVDVTPYGDGIWRLNEPKSLDLGVSVGALTGGRLSRLSKGHL